MSLTPSFIAYPHIAVIGLGYVGLPLAVALARHFPTVGFDIDTERIAQLKVGYDRTGEVSLCKDTALIVTDQVSDLTPCNVFIVSVPTPVQWDNRPDLRCVREACDIVGRAIKPPAVVVFECTVYPGVTENICGPLLEEVSGLKVGKDFFLAYSPERINPGDSEHSLDKMVKVISAAQPEVIKILAHIYGRITQVFIAKDIATAETAKVIENAQRDINVAFINEVTMITSALGLSVYDVLEAASTKWNFLSFSPGLVGGHCIGVDPYYLAYCADQLGISPEVILSGRRVNEAMAKFFVSRIAEKIPLGERLLMLGVTFKENIPDLRNTKVVDMIHALQDMTTVDVHDPFADPAEAYRLYGINLLTDLAAIRDPYDSVIAAVSHTPYMRLKAQDIEQWLSPHGGGIADIKGMWRSYQWSDQTTYWCP